MTRDDLHHAICLDPTDHTLRLIYADAVEETAAGQSDYDLAEFIRLQLHHPGRDAEHHEDCVPPSPEIDRHPHPPVRFAGRCNQDCPVKREHDLLMNADNWTKNLPGVDSIDKGIWTKNLSGGVDWHSIDKDNRLIFAKTDSLVSTCGPLYRYFWDCGFPSTFEVTLSTWLRLGPEIVRAAPVLQVNISDRQPFHPSDRGGFLWFPIPREIFQWLPGAHRAPVPSKIYKSEKDAMLALSEVCIDLARNKAGLATFFFRSPGGFDLPADVLNPDLDGTSFAGT